MSKLLLLTLFAGVAGAQQVLPAPCDKTVPALTTLSGTDKCSKCQFHLLPGKAVPADYAKYTIHSDLPELFLTDGTLYSTKPILPAFQDKQGNLVPEAMRTQKSNGFTTIDGDFEVFLFHITHPTDGSNPRRVVVYVENDGTGPVQIDPKQVIINDGIIGTVHEMESNLGRRVLAEEWDDPVGTVTIAPGQGAVVAYSKMLASTTTGPDSTKNINCFGIVRADASSTDGSALNLKVSTMAIPAKDPAQNSMLAKMFSFRGAKSGEGAIDFMTEPADCALRRVIGVHNALIWKSDEVPVNIADVPQEGVRFQMAAAASQTVDCPDVQQTQPMLLHPPYTRGDSVGNYMMEYRVTLRLVNPTSMAKTADVRFGKDDADIGLAWQIQTGDTAASDQALQDSEVQTGWAGPKQQQDLPNDTRSFLAEPIVLAPCSEQVVSLRFMILGNSSLPFQIEVAAPGE